MYNLLFKKSTFRLKYFSFSSELLPLIALSQILPSKLHKSKSDIKISLGIFNKEGLYVNSNLDVELTKDQPLWLLENMDEIKLGTLKRATNLSNPYVSKLSFTSKHGKNFKGGSSKGKFNLVFKFE